VVRPDTGAVDHLQDVGIPAAIGHGFQHHVPQARGGPAPELAEHRVPVAEFGRQVTPRGAGARHPEDGVQHPPATTPPPGLPVRSAADPSPPRHGRHQLSESVHRSLSKAFCRDLLGGCRWNLARPHPSYPRNSGTLDEQHRMRADVSDTDIPSANSPLRHALRREASGSCPPLSRRGPPPSLPPRPPKGLAAPGTARAARGGRTSATAIAAGTGRAGPARLHCGFRSWAAAAASRLCWAPA
jgi:hypothetical protein